MKKIMKERVWASLAHVPIITVIWFTYLIIYHWDALVPGGNGSFDLFDTSKLPIKPILLTLCSIPISVSLMRYKKKSALVHDNAQAAYLFNLWLLRYYGVAFVCVLIGKYTGYHKLITLAGVAGLVVSVGCLIESIIGVGVALSGKVFPYWYPSSRLFIKHLAAKRGRR